MWKPTLNCIWKRLLQLAILWMSHVSSIEIRDAVEKSTEFTFERALEELNFGVLQILASMKNNPNEAEEARNGLTPIAIAARDGHINIIKILAPITYLPSKFTPICYAARKGHIDILKYLVPLTNNLHIWCLQTIAFDLKYHLHHEVINILES